MPVSRLADSRNRQGMSIGLGPFDSVGRQRQVSSASVLTSPPMAFAEFGNVKGGSSKTTYVDVPTKRYKSHPMKVPRLRLQIHRQWWPDAERVGGGPFYCGHRRISAAVIERAVAESYTRNREGLSVEKSKRD